VTTRQAAAGTVLTASLLLGGAGLADARPDSRPAMDRGTFPCERLEHRIAALDHQLDRLAGRKARLESALADAQADGDHRRVRRLRIQIAQVDRASARLGIAFDRASLRYDDHCTDDGPDE
jgi:hypothetical protein